MSWIVTFASCIATFVSYLAALHSRGAVFAFSVARFASRRAAYAAGFGLDVSHLAADGCLCGTCLCSVAAFVSRSATFAFGVGTFVCCSGTFAFFAGNAQHACGAAALVQLLDDVVPDGAVELGVRERIQRQRHPQEAEGGLQMAVVRLHADAKGRRNCGPFPALEEGFEDDDAASMARTLVASFG